LVDCHSFRLSPGTKGPFGGSVLNGVVLMSEINRLRESGRGIDEAIAKASQNRLRPI
jgi:Cu/Ag efflux pump CusA